MPMGLCVFGRQAGSGSEKLGALCDAFIGVLFFFVQPFGDFFFSAIEILFIPLFLF